MKKLVLLAAIIAAVMFVLKRNKDTQAEADLWREATAPDVASGDASHNGSAPASTPHGAASEN